MWPMMSNMSAIPVAHTALHCTQVDIKGESALHPCCTSFLQQWASQSVASSAFSVLSYCYGTH